MLSDSSKDLKYLARVISRLHNSVSISTIYLNRAA